MLLTVELFSNQNMMLPVTDLILCIFDSVILLNALILDTYSIKIIGNVVYFLKNYNEGVLKFSKFQAALIINRKIDILCILKAILKTYSQV